MVSSASKLVSVSLLVLLGVTICSAARALHTLEAEANGSGHVLGGRIASRYGGGGGAGAEDGHGGGEHGGPGWRRWQ